LQEPDTTQTRPTPSKRGVLDPHRGERYFTLGMVVAAPEVAHVVAHHWTVRWDAGDEPYTQAVLTHPSVHVAAELHERDHEPPRRIAEVHGLVSGVFERQLVGRGRVHGIKFRPGTFRGLLGADVATITDRVVPAIEVLGRDWEDIAARAIDADDDERAARQLESALLTRLPEPDPVALEVADLVERAEQDRDLTRADQLAELGGVSSRTLQRAFARHVGVSPKWVIRRFRLHEATERLAAGDPVDLAMLAAELGYSDQAHLTNDVRTVLGRTPAAYARAQRDAARSGTPDP
jgi:AraC-like DNA-binding protein